MIIKIRNSCSDTSEFDEWGILEFQGDIVYDGNKVILFLCIFNYLYFLLYCFVI